MSKPNIVRWLVLACLVTLAAAAFVTPMPQGPNNWANALVAVASVVYLASLFLLLFNMRLAASLFLPSIVVSLLGMPLASYPAGELNAAYDLTMYLSGFFNGAIVLLIYQPCVSNVTPS